MVDGYVSRWKYEKYSTAYNVFPSVYENELDEEKNSEFSTINSKSDTRKQRINGARQEKPKNDFIAGGAGIGVCAGLVGCLYGCCTNIHSDAFVISCTLIPFAVSLIIGILINFAMNKSYKDSIKTADYKIDEEEKRADGLRKDIKKDIDRRKAEYRDQFEQEAQKLSVNFAESELAEKVIKWMSEGFIETIKATDRSTHIQEIVVPFIFNVYENKITCNLGDFDFNIERCRNLSSPLEETALARAIASAIQVNIAMSFPEDPSGTSVVINISYIYYDDHVSVNITYSAPNGKYEVVKSW